MEKVAIILLVLFIFIVLLGPVTCFRLSRDTPEKIYNPQPGQLDDARRKLSTYTTCSTVGQRPGQTRGNADMEAVASVSEFGECPICIGPLVPEPVHTAGSDPLPTLQHVASRVEMVEARQPSGEIDTQSTRGSISVDDDIMTLNSCGHSFHSKCLSSWFLIDRHDCPVCREPYYKVRPHERRDRSFAVPPFI
ncbi:hypothetical protein BGZ63DRAFT_356807 [Mariannaea sp. PMI_226]|nr:hypothetical protein BGZ63DRAFT_356807 [Mariannaea sp. PMI_226]